MESVGAGQRVAFVGRTGSGKTYLAKALLAPVDRLIILDPKGMLYTWGVPDWSRKSEKALKNGKPVIARVPRPLDGDWEPFLWACYEAGNVTVYIDEVYGVTTSSKPSPALQALITRGRELGIGVWCATQRPVWIPLIILSECDWIFQFQLRLEEDKKRMRSIIGNEAMRDLVDHQLLAYNDRSGDAKFYQRVVLE